MSRIRACDRCTGITFKDLHLKVCFKGDLKDTSRTPQGHLKVYLKINLKIYL